MTPRFCSACGKALTDGAHFCSSCGASVSDPNPTASDAAIASAAEMSAPQAQAGREPFYRREVPLIFKGRAGEYFGIWIVNVLLSILTLGIYSAWAKVRRVRYFYGNTYLDGHNFEYHAKPRQILIGRLIVVGVLIGYQVLIAISPFFSALLIVYVFALPWAINQALSFNARMTSYRNVRFSFKGSYWGAFVIYMLFPIVVMLTLGLAMPFFSKKAANYAGNGHAYGHARFRTELRAGPLYGGLGLAFLVFLGTMALLAGTALAILRAGGGSVQEFEEPWFVAGPFAFYLGLILAAIFYRVGVRNAALWATTLEGGHGFSARLGRFAVVWITVSNLVVTILTLGLMRPWAAVRSWRYTTGHIAFLAAGSLDGLYGAQDASGNALSAEYMDLGGVDLGL